MTLEQIEASSEVFLNAADVAGVLKCQPYAINVQAQADPSKLGFPVCVTGTRVRIPRRAFLHWLEYGNAPVNVETA